jgi:thioredoxin 1
MTFAARRRPSARLGACEMRASRRTVLSWAATAVLIALVAACGDGRASPGALASDGRSGLPRLVDVGAGKCVPCKAMAPILEQLRADFAGRMAVDFVDVWVSPDAGRPYGIRVIPTQIFFGADGRELSRHEGFMSREEILARWQSHGLAF